MPRLKLARIDGGRVFWADAHIAPAGGARICAAAQTGSTVAAVLLPICDDILTSAESAQLLAVSAKLGKLAIITTKGRVLMLSAPLDGLNTVAAPTRRLVRQAST